MRRPPRICALLFVLGCAVILASSATAQTVPTSVQDLSAASSDAGVLSNPSYQTSWPSPIADHEVYSFVLLDNLEYRKDELRWGMEGWRGGDRNRFWYKSEGEQSTTSGASEGDVQALYSRLISPYFDFQAGLRYARRWGEGPSHSRVYAVVGLQGLAPYRFDIEPSLQVSQQGKVQFRLTASYDFLLARRLVLQPKAETSLALQKDNEFGILSHINDSDVGLRIRYEVRREFAPYIGVSWRQGFGSRATSLPGGFEPNSISLVAGVRLWH